MTKSVVVRDGLKESMMQSKKRMKIKDLNAVLSNNSWKNYHSLLRIVCQSTSDRFSDMVSPIDGFLRSGNIDGLVTYGDSLAGQSYTCATQHYVANQLAALIRKYPFPEGSVTFDPEAEAVKKFWSAEHRCHRINQRFRGFLKRSPFEYRLNQMRNYVTYAIGYAPKLQEVYELCDFGPGANVGVHGDDTHLARKLSSEEWSVSPSALQYGAASFAYHDQIFEYLIRDHTSADILRSPNHAMYSDDIGCFNQAYLKRAVLVTYNKIAFVPKTAKTYRSIAVEPLVNGYLQKGIDNLMRRNMKRVGLDLSEQGHNIEAARKGSLDRSEEGYVTIDLSSASDSMSIELVRNLLPPEWFELLNSVRSKEFLIDGVQHSFHKFCSMGNGFCFPLQTLIFASVCSACGAGTAGRDFYVYGDDIVVKQKFAKEVIELLNVCGFRTNRDKTFLEGPFRESCGRDWFDGEDVRPFILDFALDSLPALFKLLNLTRRNDRCTDYFQEVRDFVISLIPTDLRYMRPCEGNADTGYFVELDEFMASQHARWNTNLQCWSWLELQTKACVDKTYVRSVDYELLVMMAVLRGSPSKDPFTFRRKTSAKVRRVAYSGPMQRGYTAPPRVVYL